MEIVSSTLKLKSPLLPLVTASLLIIQLLGPSRVWEALLVVFAGAWLTGWIWARSIERGLSLERAMRFGWAQVGDALEERFTLTSSTSMPIPWVEIVDHSDVSGYQASMATCLAGRERYTWHTRGVCSRRGIFTLGGATLRSGDPLGIYSVEIQHSERATLAIMPAVVPLPEIELAPGGWLGEGRPQPQAAEKVYGASSVRPYQAGDSLHLIHWRTSARLEEPYVRNLEGAPEDDWWMVLDADSRVQAGSGPDSTLEAAVIVAASLADRARRARKNVGLLAQGEQSIWVRPRPGEAVRLEILQALAALQPGDVELTRLLERAGPLLGRRASLVIITPSLSTEWLSPLGQLAWRGITPTVILLDPASFGGDKSADALAALLAEKGITRHIIGQELFSHSQAQPGRHGQWEWRIMPTGKAVPTRLPGDMSWKRLG